MFRTFDFGNQDIWIIAINNIFVAGYSVLCTLRTLTSLIHTTKCQALLLSPFTDGKTELVGTHNELVQGQDLITGWLAVVHTAQNVFSNAFFPSPLPFSLSPHFSGGKKGSRTLNLMSRVLNVQLSRPIR